MTHSLVPLIGFCGYAGAGKSTAASLLASLGYRRERFAGPLKDMLYALGLTREEVDGQLKEEPCALLGGATPRHAMVELGTAWGRERIHPDLWTMAWARRVDSLLSKGFRVACDDVRFVNEAAAIRSRGGIIVRITSTRAGKRSDHISESLPFEWDFTVTNDGPVSDLAHWLNCEGRGPIWRQPTEMAA